MTATNFNTQNLTFRQLLGNGLQYHVPAFQRDYSWDVEEWDDLWQDMLGLFSDSAEPFHYMGYLVLQSSDLREFSIVDGQQRLSTISIMILSGLRYLRDLSEAGLDSIDNGKRREQLMASYIGYLDPVTLVPSPKLRLNRHNDKFYQTYLIPLEPMPERRINSSEQMLRKATVWFHEKIKNRFGWTAESGREFTAFIDKLVDKLRFTVITVDDELNAFKVFETLNARGVRLSSTDLLKNHLFSIISTRDTHDHEITALETLWEQIVGELGSERFPEFMRVFWNSRHPFVRKAELFKAIRKQVSNRQQAFELVRKMDRAVSIYMALRDASSPLWNGEEANAVQELAMFSVRQPMALLLSAHEMFYTAKRPTFTKIISTIAVISFRYNVICGLPTHEQERLYNEVARKIHGGDYDTLTKVLQALTPVYPSDIQFKAAFAEKELRTTASRNRKVLRHIFHAIEKQASGLEFDPESPKYTIEHVLPENPSTSWSDIPEAKQDALIYRLGNMTLLADKANRKAGNNDFAAKREIYRHSEFAITRKIAESAVWNEGSIASRQKELAAIASAVWRRDMG